MALRGTTTTTTGDADVARIAAAATDALGTAAFAEAFARGAAMSRAEALTALEG